MLKKIDKMPIYTDVETLDSYCEYLLNDHNKTITYSNLSNLRDFVNMMDPKILMTNDAKMARYYFITYYLEARLEKGIVKRSLALQYVMDQAEPKYEKIIRREIINSIEPDQLTKKDIEFMNSMIFAQLNVQFMHKYQIGMTKLIEDVNNNDFGKSPEDCDNAIQFLQVLLGELTKAQRRSKQENRFNLTDTTHFKAVLAEACERVLSGSTFLKTGYVALNSMLNGGLENARVYNFIGATGGFKSGLLLNLMKTIKMNNKGREHKDPTKRQTILFVSQENNIWETIERIFGIFTGAGKMKNYDSETIIRLLEEGGFCCVQDDLDIDIEFRYYGNMDIGVPDLKGIVEELDAEGKEVILIIQDYIERLKPPIMSVDRRLQLADVSNQLHDLAIDLDVPIVTASQLNRSGVSTIEQTHDSNKVDAGKNVGMRDISESFGMLKNFDANIAIVVEYAGGEEERYYLSFRALKYRGDDSEAIGYFLQPFVGKKSKIQLAEDLNLDKPVYRLSMTDDSILELMNAQERKDFLERRTKQNLSSSQVFDMSPEDAGVVDGFMKAVEDQQLADMKFTYIGRTSQLLNRGEDGFIHLSHKASNTSLKDHYYHRLNMIEAQKMSQTDINQHMAQPNQDEVVVNNDAFAGLYRT